MSTPNVRTRRRKERKVWRSALVVSLLFHLLVFLAGGRRPLPIAPFAAAGPKAGDARAARGGMQAMDITVPPPRPIVPPPLPVPAAVEVEPLEFDTEPEFDLAAILGERPGVGPPGLDGDGEGDGGTESEGLGGIVAPKPRGMIMPPDHKDLKNTEVTVWVFVNEHGQVVADSTRLEPLTRNRDLNRQIIQRAAQWIFRPATRLGQPVAAWTNIRFGMSGTGRVPSRDR